MDEALESAPPAKLDIPVCRAVAEHPELRAAAAESSSPGTMVGEFALFDQWYEIRSYWEGHFIERVVAGAFKRTINNRSGETPVRVLLEHGWDPQVGDKPLGVPDVLEERDAGPYAETPLLDTAYCRDLAPALAAGAYGQSFRFQVLRDEWVEEPEPSDYNPKGLPERTITEVRLIEFGPTVFPASPGTNDTTGLRSLSTTDEFYERLQRRDPARYDDALQSVRSARVPAPAPESTRTEADPAAPPADPQPEHSEDPAVAERDDHSPDSPDTHSTDPSSNTTDDQNRNSTMDENENLTVEERAARKDEIRSRLNDIASEYAGAELPTETQQEWDSLRSEHDEHERAIEAHERRQAQLAEIAGDDAATEGTSSQRGNPRTPTRRAGGGVGTGSTSRRGTSIYDLSSIRQEARSMDDMARITRDRARSAIDEARFPGVDDPAAAAERANRLLDTVDDETGTLARRILVTGSPVYERAFGKLAAHGQVGALTVEEQRALSLGTNGEGGYAVPFQLDPTVILTNSGVEDPIRRIARVESITGKEWQGLTTAGITASRKAEKAESDDNSPSFGQPTVRTSRVDAFVPFTVELEQDWNSMRGELTKLLVDAKATEEGDSFINGDGSANAGSDVEPGGVLATLPTGSKVETLVANAVSSDDLYEVEESLPQRFLGNASWLAARSFFNAVRQLGSESDGGDLWVRLAQGQPPELIGYPAIRHSGMPGFATTNGTKVGIFGDFSQFLIVDRVGMNVELVPHLFGDNGRPKGMRGIWAFWRNGSKVLVPGAFRYLQIKAGA